MSEVQITIGKTSKPRYYCLLIPGRGYSPRARHARAYKEQIKKIARKKIRDSFDGKVAIKLEYLYWERTDKIDGDNLLKTICDALKGVAYEDDGQIVDHRVRTINGNSSFTITGLPLDLPIADLFVGKKPFAIIRLRKRAS